MNDTDVYEMAKAELEGSPELADLLKIEGEEKKHLAELPTDIEIMKAKIPVLKRKAEEQTVNGDLAGARKTLAEAAEFEAAVPEFENELLEVRERLNQFKERKRLLAGKTLEKLFPSLRQEYFEALQKALDLGLAMKDGYERFPLKLTVTCRQTSVTGCCPMITSFSDQS